MSLYYPAPALPSFLAPGGVKIHPDPAVATAWLFTLFAPAYHVFAGVAML